MLKGVLDDKTECDVKFQSNGGLVCPENFFSSVLSLCVSTS